MPETGIIAPTFSPFIIEGYFTKYLADLIIRQSRFYAFQRNCAKGRPDKRPVFSGCKSQDPQTCLTETAIRTRVRSGRVPCVRVGKKYLVTIEALETYLAGTAEPGSLPEPKSKKVWRIE